MDQNKIQITQEVRGFLDGLLQDANMKTLDSAMREEMIKELYARLDSFLTTTIIDNMPAEYLDEFVRLNEEKKSADEIQKFIHEKMPNAQDVFSKAFMDFRELYLGNVSAARNSPQQN